MLLRKRFAQNCGITYIVIYICQYLLLVYETWKSLRQIGCTFAIKLGFIHISMKTFQITSVECIFAGAAPTKEPNPHISITPDVKYTSRNRPFMSAVTESNFEFIAFRNSLHHKSTSCTCTHQFYEGGYLKWSHLHPVLQVQTRLTKVVHFQSHVIGYRTHLCSVCQWLNARTSVEKLW